MGATGTITIRPFSPFARRPVFEGPPSPDARVQFYGILNSRISLGHVSTNIARVLTETNDRTAVHSYSGPGYIDPALERFNGVNPQAPIGILVGRTQDCDPNSFRHELMIGGFVASADRIPPAWVAVCNALDVVVVPSYFCQAAFEASGVTSPVVVVPYGVEREYRAYGPKAEPDPFIFYYTFASSPRKNGNGLVRCFNYAFGARNDIKLRLRTDAHFIEQAAHSGGLGKNILLEVIDNASVEAFARIYTDVHCTVHPSESEGFGLIPLQSIACETPVIAPACTGTADYLAENNAVLVNTLGWKPGEGGADSYGRVCVIDEDHLVDRMRYIVDSWPAEYEKVKSVAAAFRVRHSWQNACASLVDMVNEVLVAESIAAGKRILLERLRDQRVGA